MTDCQIYTLYILGGTAWCLFAFFFYMFRIEEAKGKYIPENVLELIVFLLFFINPIIFLLYFLRAMWKILLWTIEIANLRRMDNPLRFLWEKDIL